MLPTPARRPGLTPGCPQQQQKQVDEIQIENQRPEHDEAASGRVVVELLADVESQAVFMSFDGERPAGTGAIYIDGKTAALDWGATHPDFRRRGGQTAVLAARIRYAIEQGCDLICTMTGEAVPGDPQHSYRNIQKNGFSEAYLRENWIT